MCGWKGERRGKTLKIKFVALSPVQRQDKHMKKLGNQGTVSDLFVSMYVKVDWKAENKESWH